MFSMFLCLLDEMFKEERPMMKTDRTNADAEVKE